MSLDPLPNTTHIAESNGNITASYRSWLVSVQTWLGPIGKSGSTSTRPTSGLYVGQQYFDTTLGYPVFLKTVGPPSVWVNGSGSPV